MPLNEYQTSLVGAVSGSWKALSEGRKIDREEFEREQGRKDERRRLVFVDAVVKARAAQIPWSELEGAGVSKPTMRKYAGEAIEAWLEGKR